MFTTTINQPAFLDNILKGRPEDAKQKLKDALIVAQSKLSKHNSIEDCISICNEVFLPIKGIGEITALRCAMYLANQLDIDPEANCACFLINPAKKTLDKRGWINGKTVRIGKSIQDLMRDYSPLLFVDFANKHYRILH